MGGTSAIMELSDLVRHVSIMAFLGLRVVQSYRMSAGENQEGFDIYDRVKTETSIEFERIICVESGS